MAQTTLNYLFNRNLFSTHYLESLVKGDTVDEQWFFSVVDVVGALTDSSIPRRYWSDLKSNLLQEGFELYDKIVQLTLQAEDGKMRLTDCANTESMFRIIQSIPSKKAEPFKRWR